MKREALFIDKIRVGGLAQESLAHKMYKCQSVGVDEDTGLMNIHSAANGH